jgi:hypothetical protein
MSLLLDGSFEQSAAGTGLKKCKGTTCIFDNEISVWKSTGTLELNRIMNPKDGYWVINLSSDESTRLSQDIKLAPGSYSLDFFTSKSRQCGSTAGNAGVTGIMEAPFSTAESTAWKENKLSFKIDKQGTYQVFFESVTSGSPCGPLLDDITLTRVSQAPESVSVSSDTVDPTRETAIIVTSIVVFVVFLSIVVFFIWKRFRKSAPVTVLEEKWIAVESQRVSESYDRWDSEIGYLAFERGDEIKVLRRESILVVGRNESTGKEGVLVPSKLASLGYQRATNKDRIDTIF